MTRSQKKSVQKGPLGVSGTTFCSKKVHEQQGTPSLVRWSFEYLKGWRSCCIFFRPYLTTPTMVFPPTYVETAFPVLRVEFVSFFFCLCAL